MAHEREPSDLHRKNGALLVSAQGKVTIDWSPRGLDGVTRAAGLGLALVLDLQETSLDLGGAGALLKVQVWAERLGVPLAGFGASPPLANALRTTGLFRGLPLFETEGEALSCLAGAVPAGSGHPLRAGAQPPPGWARSEVPLRAEPSLAGRRAVGPPDGFGQLWEHVHRVRLAGAPEEPEEVVALWKAEFGAFWPAGNTATVGPSGIAPGEAVAFKLAAPGGLPLSTGALVLYADEVSFGFCTLEGHIQAGWILFSAKREEGTTVAEVRSLVRAGDPLYDAGISIVGQHFAEHFWQRTLESLAARLGVRGLAVSASSCLDARRQWSRATNARHNAGVEGLFYGAIGLARRFLPGRQ